MGTRRIWNSVKNVFRKRSLALMYHRIGDVSIDPWELTVTPQHFAEQLQVLVDNYQVLRASEFVSQVNSQSIGKNGVCLTFDDGYRDNYLAARPILEKYNCPATFFIASGFIGKAAEFWWDALVGLLLAPKTLPQVLDLEIDGKAIHYDPGEGVELTPADSIKQERWVWPATAPTRRCEIYLDVWERLKPLPFDKINPVLKSLETWAGDRYTPDPVNFPMSVEELNVVFNHPLIDTGIHTVSHPALASHPADFQRQEILQCKAELDLLGQKNHDIMAYPYGNYNSDTINVARELKLAGAFTTSETAVDNQTAAYQVGRFQVKNWNGDTFRRQMNAWLINN